MMPNNPDSLKKFEQSKFLLCFCDLETRQETENMFQHEPNLCISQQVCQACITNDNQGEICNRCGVRENIFYGTDSVERFLNHLAKLSINFNVTVIAHNQGRFDGCFILSEMYKDFSRWTPEIVRTGTKLLLIQCGSSLRFIDSLNFIQLPLSQFPKAFYIAGCKGYFPHYFNTIANENYVGGIPDVGFYGADLMKPREREVFLNWHREQRAAGYVFEMRREIIKYWRADVNILWQSCLKFLECFLNTNNVDPLLECITIASACNLVFRRNFLKPETIGIIPQNGYCLADKRDALFLRRENTVKKEDRLKLAGYNVVTMWECDFRKTIERDEELATFIKNERVTSQLHLKARDSFFGGRTNAANLYYKCGSVDPTCAHFIRS
jgi:hypothetical protein